MAHPSKASLDVAGMAAIFAMLLRIALKAITAMYAGYDHCRFLGQLLLVPVPPLGTALVGAEPLLLTVFLLGNRLSTLCAKIEICAICLLWYRLDALALAKGLDGVLR